MTWNAGGWAGAPAGVGAAGLGVTSRLPLIEPDDREVAAGELERQRHERLRDEAADLGGRVDDAAGGRPGEGVGCVDARAGAAEDALGLEDGEPDEALEEIGGDVRGEDELAEVGVHRSWPPCGRGGIAAAWRVHTRGRRGMSGEGAVIGGRRRRASCVVFCTRREEMRE